MNKPQLVNKFTVSDVRIGNLAGTNAIEAINRGQILGLMAAHIVAAHVKGFTVVPHEDEPQILCLQYSDGWDNYLLNTRVINKSGVADLGKSAEKGVSRSRVTLRQHEKNVDRFAGAMVVDMAKFPEVTAYAILDKEFLKNYRELPRSEIIGYVMRNRSAA